MKKIPSMPAFGILAVLIIACAALALYKDPYFKSVDRLAHDAVAACPDIEDHSSCYESSIPSLMDWGVSMEKTFAVVARIQELDPLYTSCHVLAHEISAKETAKDPSKWKDVLIRAPFGVCGNGASHGAFQERFRGLTQAMSDAEIAHEIDGVCDDRAYWHPSIIERSNCIHGIGHLLMYMTLADVPRATRLCMAVAGNRYAHDFRQTCLEGIFMQVFQPLEESDKEMVAPLKLTPQNALAYCDHFAGLVRAMCIRGRWSLDQNMIATPRGFTKYCAPLIAESADYAYCVDGETIAAFTAIFNSNPDTTLALCNQLDDSLRSRCIAATAFQVVQNDWRALARAILVCDAAPARFQDACYSMLIAYGQNAFMPQSFEAVQLCAGIPQRWKSQCSIATQTAL